MRLVVVSPGLSKSVFSSITVSGGLHANGRSFVSGETWKHLQGTTGSKAAREGKRGSKYSRQQINGVVS